MIGIFLFIKFMSYLSRGDYVIQEIIDKFSLFITRKGWTQEKAAEEIECSQEHLSRVLRGKKTPSVKLLMKMEEVMKKEE